MNRRNLLATSLSLALFGCSATEDPMAWTRAKAYMKDGLGAVLASAQQYVALKPPPDAKTVALVTSIVGSLQVIDSSLDGAVTAAEWRTLAAEALADVQILLPYVAVFLGPAAPFIGMAVAVVEAFVQHLPPPPDAPAVPPAALKMKAKEYVYHAQPKI